MPKPCIVGLILLLTNTLCWGARDPTQPPTVNRLVLNAIIFSSVQQAAIISGKFVRVGDKIDDVSILKIMPQMVLGEGMNGKVTLVLNKYSVKSNS